MEFLNKHLKNEEIVCISTSDWETPYGSKQQIMSILAKNNRVLYVEAQRSILHIFKNPILEYKRIKRWIRGLSKKGSLYIYTPLPLLPFGNYSFFINRINQAILLLFLKMQLKILSFKEPILWIYLPNSFLLLKRMNEKKSIYYCIDDFPSEINISRRKRVLRTFEKNILKQADIVFTCTRSLFKERIKLRPEIHFIRNGVDYDSFSKNSYSGILPKDIQNIGFPKIGFMGTLDFRINTELLAYLASENPHWQIILIGNNMLSYHSRSNLKKYHNVHFLGIKPHKLLPYYIGIMDVCIIPYRIGSFNDYIFPLKTLEYLASGKPVVSTNLPELKEFRAVLKLSLNNIDFVKNVKISLENNNAHEVSKRREVAALYAWEKIMEKLSEIIRR